ncbi:cytochrome P450 oxidoreductase [Leptodontidium sp. 2 PMI_412]|nr:cytochrome P450 oxidoreductase [Leptodontidium sp. 2 PMI_412]
MPPSLSDAQPLTELAVVLKILAASFGVYLVSVAIYNRYFHPLKDFPGPFWASITSLWYYRSIITIRHDDYQLEIHRKYGPMVRLAPGHIQIADPTAIDTIYGAKQNFLKSHFYLPFDAKISPTPDNFVIRDDKAHTERRRAVAHIYTQGAVLEYEPCVDRVIDIFEERMEQFAESGEVVDISTWFRKYTFDVIGEMFYGKEGGFGFIRDNIDVNNWCRLLEVVVRPMTAIAYVPYGLQSVFLLSQLVSAETRAGVLGFFTVVQQANSTLKQRLDDMAAKRPISLTDGLSKLINVANEKGKKSRFGMQDVAAEIFAIIFAGADTTSTALTAIFYFLHKHPETLVKLREEIDTAFAEGKVTYPVRFNDANKLPYLRAVVSEAARLHPSLGLSLPRLVPPGGADICGKFIPGGYEVAMNPAVIQMDHTIFGDDADQFVPERWIRDGERAAANMERHFLQFGYGKRICIGKNIANTEMYKLLPSILHKYDFELTGNKTWTVRREWFQQQKNVNIVVSRRETGMAKKE